jgi:uracil-DNA glycosylase
MKNCVRCPLRSQCTQVVTGVGSFTSRLLIVGEAPGQDEDTMGEPFVGRSGDLLNQILKKANVNREDIYISNTIKCRPPKNRIPNKNEIERCKIWLWKEIKALTYLKVIMPLGGIATKLLLKLPANTLMKTVVGTINTVEYTSAKITPWYHPSYLIRHNNHRLLTTTEIWFRRVKELL